MPMHVQIKHTHRTGWPNQFVYAFGFRLCAIGITEITAANAEEVWRRWTIADKLWGCAVQLNTLPDLTSVDWNPSKEEIAMFIGSTANASPMTTAAFNKHATSMRNTSMGFRASTKVHEHLDAMDSNTDAAEPGAEEKTG